MDELGRYAALPIRAYCSPIRRHLRPLSAVISVGARYVTRDLPRTYGNDGRCSVRGWRRLSDVDIDAARCIECAPCIDAFRMSRRVPQVSPILIETSVLHPRGSTRVAKSPSASGVPTARGTRPCRLFPPRRGAISNEIAPSAL